MKRVIGDLIEYVKDIVLPPKKRRTDNSEAQGSTTTTVAKTDSYTAQKLPTIKVLPDELLKHICFYIGDGSYDTIAPVSKRFKKVYVQPFPSKVTYIKNAAASISLAQMFLKEMKCDTKAIGEAYHKLILYSIELGNMTVLQWAIRNKKKYLHGRNLVIHKNMLRSNVYPDVAAETGDIYMLKYLKSLGCMFTAKTMFEAVSSDNLKCVKYLRRVGCPWNMLSSVEAIQGNNIELVRYLYEEGCEFDPDCDEYAAYWGLLDIVNFLFETHLPCRHDVVFINTAQGGQLSCLKKLYEKGYPLGAQVYYDATCEALYQNRLDCLQYLFDIGAPFDREDCCAMAAEWGSLDCLRYLHKKGYPLDEESCVLATRHGALDCLTYLRDNSCPWSPQCIVEAVKVNHVDILRYLHTNGCPFANLQMHCRNAIEHGSIDCLKYLHEAANCALDNAGFCTIAASRGNVEILTYLRENNCPWDKRECCRVAIEENHFNCLKFLMENGCSMVVHAEECFRMAVRVGSVECFQYFHDKEFSWDPKYCTSASVSRWRDLDCLKYLLENGFKLDLNEADYLGIIERYQDDAIKKKEYYLDRYYCYGEGMIGAWRVFKRHDEAEAQVKGIRRMIDKIAK